MNETISFRAVDRRSGLSVREFKGEYFNRTPVVVTDALESWEARASWTVEELKARLGKTPVRVQGFRNGLPNPELDRQMPFGEYIENILRKDFQSFPFYLRDNYSLFVDHKHLWKDFAHPKYCFDWFKFLPDSMVRPGPRIFIGPRGSMQNLHQDMWGTYFWMAQLAGRKRWILFSPDQKQFLYEPQANGATGRPVRPDNPDLKRYPLITKTRGLECTIGPGDLIIVPRDWFHWVHSLDPTISLTHNYMGPGNFRSCLAGQMRWTFSVARHRGANP